MICLGKFSNKYIGYSFWDYDEYLSYDDYNDNETIKMRQWL